MKRITFADRTVLVTDETSDTLVEYAALLGASHTADTVRIRAIGLDGDDVTVDLVLNAATNMIAESTHSSTEPPPNTEAIAYMRERLDVLRHGQPASPQHAVDIPRGIDGIDEI
jgi:hypothetical protein